MRAVQGVLLGHACNGKRLTGKSGQQHIMRRNIGLAHFANVTGNLMRVIREVRTIGLLAIAVPLAGENALSVDGLKAPAKSANTREQIDKCESRFIPPYGGRLSSRATANGEKALKWQCGVSCHARPLIPVYFSGIMTDTSAENNKGTCGLKSFQTKF